MLTFWEGSSFGGLSDGTDYIYNDHYQQIAAIHAGVGSTSEFGYALVVTIKIDPWTRTATLIASDNEPQGEVATSQGNGQHLWNGGEFVGWGILPDISEFDAAGNLVFNAEFPTGVNTYRAYLLPWVDQGATG